MPLLLAILFILATPYTIVEPPYSYVEPTPRVNLPEQIVERRKMRITAYTEIDRGMNGKGITASGERVREHYTLAAPHDIPFGTEIYIPELGRTYTVCDRGSAIRGNRLDLYMGDRRRALEFGVKYLEVIILADESEVIK